MVLWLMCRSGGVQKQKQKVVTLVTPAMVCDGDL
jgi:hypothetical protein